MLKRSKSTLFKNDIHTYLFIGALYGALVLFFKHDVFWFALGIPAVLGLTYMALRSIKELLYTSFFLIPFSSEYTFPMGFALDIPTEPIFIFIAFCSLFLFIKNAGNMAFHKGEVLLPIILAAHLIWIAISSLYSQEPIISAKFFLAKMWYVVPFYFLPFMLKLTDEDYRRIFQLFMVGVLLSAAYFFLRHFQQGLEFEARTNAGKPIFRNHVNYACMLVLCLPTTWYLWCTTKSDKKHIYLIGMCLLCFFIYFSYARVAYACLIFSAVILLIIRYKLFLYAVLLSLFVGLFASVWLNRENSYLRFAPDYERTITQTRFDDLLSATYRMEDISVMERVYRWTGAVNMFLERPLTGFGPGSFYSHYKKYTIGDFKTYVSNNPDKSGTHSYFLMLLSEQGLPGTVIFTSFLFGLLYRGQRLYHLQKTNNTGNVNLTIAATFIVASVIAMNTINDMVEVIKVGPILFFAAYILSTMVHSKEEPTTTD